MSVKTIFNKLHRVPETYHSVWMLMGQLMVSMAAFVLTYVLANYVSKEVVGEYRFVLAAYSTISVFALYGLGTSLMQSVATGASGSVHVAWRKKIRYGLIGSVLFCGLAIYYYFTNPEGMLFWALLLTAALLPALEAYGLYGSYLQGAKAFKLSAIFLAADRLVTTLSVVATVFIAPTLFPIVAVYFLAHGIMVVILYYLSLDKIPPNHDEDTAMMPYAQHVTVMSLLSAVTSQLDKYVLFFFFGPIPLALYWVASVLPQEVARVVSVVSGTFFPRYVTMGHEALLGVVRKLYWASAASLGMICILYCFLAPTIFHLFLPQYKDADGISAVLMLGLGFIPYYMVWQIFSAKKNVSILYYISLGEPIFVILLYPVLIPLYGIWGIAFTLLIKMAVMNILAVWYLYRARPVL